MPGYRLLAPLGRGGFGEVWKCTAPGGLHKAIKFVHREVEDDDPEVLSSLRQESEAFERIKSIRHPFLLTLERVEWIDGDLVMVMELADRSLGHRYDECRDAGLPGIPRRELLSYMVDAAEALDVLGLEHGLQHLDVKPANLFLLGGHVKVGDYGLVARHKSNRDGDDEPKLGRGLTPKYVAPEILFDRIDARSDQYPLALVYQELLTGEFPYGGRTAQQLLLQHASGEPDLTALPAGDREAVGRALAKDPADRFPSCLSFVKALLRDEAATGTKVVSATTRQMPTTRPAPKDGEATRRLSAGVVAEMRVPSEHELEFNGHFSGWTYVAERPSTPRGRVVLVSDEVGDFHCVHLVRLQADNGSACGSLLDALERLGDRVLRTVRAHEEGVGFALPERGHTLKEWIAQRKPESEPGRRRTVHRSMLAPVAATLDALHSEAGFPHALLSPSTLLQSGATWGVALYGLGELLRRTRGDHEWIAAESYAAPEAILGLAVSASDQYSLALIYLELCGAWAPPERRGPRADRSGIVDRVDRDNLTACEWVAVKQATASKPEQRFPSCSAFFAALDPPPTDGVALDEVRAVESVDRLQGRGASRDHPPRPERLTRAILLAVGADAVASWPSPKSDSLIIRLPDGRLTGRFPVKLTAELAALKLDAFRDQHRLDLAQWTADTFALKPKPGAARAAGKGVELVVRLPESDLARAGELVVTGRAVGRGDAAKSEPEVIALMEQFRRAVQNTNERRKSPRFRTDLAICVYRIDDELAVHAPIVGVCRDVSESGFACVLPSPILTGHAFVTFPTLPEFAPWAIIATIVRSRALVDGAVAVAGRFVHVGT